VSSLLRTMVWLAGHSLLPGIMMVLTACGTIYRTPRPDTPPLPARFEHAPPKSEIALDTDLDHWWQAFNDPALDALVDRVLARNNTLAAAVWNLKAAQAQVHLAVTNPTATGSFEAANSKVLNRNRPWMPSETLSVAVSYDLDLWGALAATRDVARFEARATEQDRDSITATLVANTVRSYFEIAALNEMVKLNDEDIADARKSLSLTRVLEDAGSVSALDVAIEEQNIEALLALRSTFTQQRVLAGNILAALLDDDVAPAFKGLRLPRAAMAALAPGLPATLLERRPDLRAADLRLRESLAGVEATRRSFYPDLALTASVGTNSIALNRVLSDPVGTLAATLTFPFLQVDRAHFATEAARAEYEAAAKTFRQTLRQALIDVDNALSARAQDQLQLESLEKSHEAAQKAEHLSGVLYRSGKVPLPTLLTAQAARRAAAQALVSARVQALQDYATLCLALGGGP
jgi:NodT family efflux transporter outer membrane factor (OMF) lipoprotein